MDEQTATDNGVYTPTAEDRRQGAMFTALEIAKINGGPITAEKVIADAKLMQAFIQGE